MRFFRILARFWEARGRQKIEKKIEKIAFGTLLERVWDSVSILDTILDRFWWVLKRFCMDFGRILEGCREDKFWLDRFGDGSGSVSGTFLETFGWIWG